MLKVDNSDLLELQEKASKSENGLSRICLHNLGSEKVQLMIIAAIPGKIYPPISDNLPGWISYTVLKGSLKIKTYEEKHLNKNITYELNTGETLRINRNIYRETISDSIQGAIFMEVIEGIFDKSKRTSLKDEIYE